MSRATDRTVAVIVVNWNRASLTRDCVEALRRSKDASWHCFVVDNASADDSLETLSALGDDVTLIRSDVNGGWAGGNNLGVAAALRAGYDHLFLLNNDALVEPHAIARLLRTAEQESERRPILGAPQLEDDGGNGWFGASDTGTKIFPDIVKTNDAAGCDAVYETAFVKGAALFCHREHFQMLGMFDERFFLNFEEHDWCTQAINSGFPVLMVRDAVVHHAGSGTMGGVSSPLNIYFLVRNALLYAEKNRGRRDVPKAFVERLEWARGRYGTRNWAVASLRTIVSRAPWGIAFRMAVRDYVFRRFGDCPPVIRKLTYG